MELVVAEINSSNQIKSSIVEDIIIEGYTTIIKGIIIKEDKIIMEDIMTIKHHIIKVVDTIMAIMDIIINMFNIFAVTIHIISSLNHFNISNFMDTHYIKDSMELLCFIIQYY